MYIGPWQEYRLAQTVSHQPGGDLRKLYEEWESLREQVGEQKAAELLVRMPLFRQGARGTPIRPSSSSSFSKHSYKSRFRKPKVPKRTVSKQKELEKKKISQVERMRLLYLNQIQKEKVDAKYESLPKLVTTVDALDMLPIQTPSSVPSNAAHGFVSTPSTSSVPESQDYELSNGIDTQVSRRTNKVPFAIKKWTSTSSNNERDEDDNFKHANSLSAIRNATISPPKLRIIPRAKVKAKSMHLIDYNGMERIKLPKVSTCDTDEHPLRSNYDISSTDVNQLNLKSQQQLQEQQSYESPAQQASWEDDVDNLLAWTDHLEDEYDAIMNI